MGGNRRINLLGLVALKVGVLTVAAWVVGSIPTDIQAEDAIVRRLTTRTVRGGAGPRRGCRRHRGGARPVGSKSPPAHGGVAARVGRPGNGTAAWGAVTPMEPRRSPCK